MSSVSKVTFRGENTNLLTNLSQNKQVNKQPDITVSNKAVDTNKMLISSKKAETAAYISSALAVISLGVAGTVMIKGKNTLKKSNELISQFKKQAGEFVEPKIDKVETYINKELAEISQKLGEVKTGLDTRFKDVYETIQEKADWFDGVNNGFKKDIGNVEKRLNDNIYNAVKSGNNGNAFLTRTVTVNNLEMRLAKIEHEVYGDADIQLNNTLRTEAAKRILGTINRNVSIPENPVIRVASAEVRPFSNTGGMSVVPKEFVTNLVALINNKQNAKVLIDTPAYTGQVSKGNWLSIEKNADGKTYSYISTTKNIHGQVQKEQIAQLEKIDKLDLNILTEDNKVLEKVNIYLTEPKKETVDFNMLKPRLDVDLRHAIADGLKKEDKFENELLIITRNKETQQIEAQAKIRYVLYENDNFNMDARINVDGNIYRHDTTNGITEPERFAKFSRFFSEHMFNSAKSTNNLGADMIITNDWSTGFIPAIMRQLTTIRKAYGMDPVIADHYHDIPIVHVLHNAKESGWEWAKQSRIFNIMFGEHSAKAVENSYMINAAVGDKSKGMNGKILNALMENESVNPQVMAASYSDYVVPVSEGYATNVSTTGVYGYASHDIYRLRAREWEFKNDKDLLKTIAYNNGIDPNGFDLSKPTLIGITNGCDRANNVLTPQKASDLVKKLYLPKDTSFKIFQPGADALSVHNHNKQIYLDKVKRDIETARSGKGNPMNIVLPEITDLSNVTVDTPVFSTAGRIVDQKGLDIFAQSIKEFYKDFKGTNYPVFYAQGVGDMQYINKFLEIKQEIAKINPEAAKRIVFGKLFTEPGRYDGCKLMSDFTIMSSWFEPCGLVHKEIAPYSGAIPIVTDTGGLKSGLIEGLNVIISKFIPKEDHFVPLEQNGKYFAEALHKAYDLFGNKTKFTECIDASFRADHSWLRYDGAMDKYTKIFVDMKVLDPSVLTYAKLGKITNLYDNTESSYKVINRRIGTNPPSPEERKNESWIKTVT